MPTTTTQVTSRLDALCQVQYFVAQIFTDPKSIPEISQLRHRGFLHKSDWENIKQVFVIEQATEQIVVGCGWHAVLHGQVSGWDVDRFKEHCSALDVPLQFCSRHRSYLTSADIAVFNRNTPEWTAEIQFKFDAMDMSRIYHQARDFNACKNNNSNKKKSDAGKQRNNLQYNIGFTNVSQKRNAQTGIATPQQLIGEDKAKVSTMNASTSLYRQITSALNPRLKMHQDKTDAEIEYRNALGKGVITEHNIFEAATGTCAVYDIQHKAKNDYLFSHLDRHNESEVGLDIVMVASKIFADQNCDNKCHRASFISFMKSGIGHRMGREALFNPICDNINKRLDAMALDRSSFEPDKFRAHVDSIVVGGNNKGAATSTTTTVPPTLFSSTKLSLFCVTMNNFERAMTAAIKRLLTMKQMGCLIAIVLESALPIDALRCALESIQERSAWPQPQDCIVAQVLAEETHPGMPLEEYNAGTKRLRHLGCKLAFVLSEIHRNNLTHKGASQYFKKTSLPFLTIYQINEALFVCAALNVFAHRFIEHCFFSPLEADQLGYITKVFGQDYSESIQDATKSRDQYETLAIAVSAQCKISLLMASHILGSIHIRHFGLKPLQIRSVATFSLLTTEKYTTVKSKSQPAVVIRTNANLVALYGKAGSCKKTYSIDVTEYNMADGNVDKFQHHAAKGNKKLMRHAFHQSSKRATEPPLLRKCHDLNDHERVKEGREHLLDDVFVKTLQAKKAKCKRKRKKRDKNINHELSNNQTVVQKELYGAYLSASMAQAGKGATCWSPTPPSKCVCKSRSEFMEDPQLIPIQCFVPTAVQAVVNATSIDVDLQQRIESNVARRDSIQLQLYDYAGKRRSATSWRSRRPTMNHHDRSLLKHHKCLSSDMMT